MTKIIAVSDRCPGLCPAVIFNSQIIFTKKKKLPDRIGYYFALLSQ